jgi:hypothetical protein
MPVLINDVPVSCINQAAISYHLPAALILSVMQKENGRNGQAIHNKNGTFDLGVMQINTLWLPTLKRYGYTRDELQFNPCKNIEAATWILAKSLASGETAWSGVGNYHSHMLNYNQSYSSSVHALYQKITSVIL